MVYAQPITRPGDETHKLLWDFEIQTDHLILARQPDSQQKKTEPLLFISADHRVKLKESEKRDEYPDLAWELRKLLYMKVTIMPIVIGTLSTVPKEVLKGLENLEIRGQMETIQTTALLISARILRRVLETWGDLLLLKLLLKPIC